MSYEVALWLAGAGGALLGGGAGWLRGHLGSSGSPWPTVLLGALLGGLVAFTITGVLAVASVFFYFLLGPIEAAPVLAIALAFVAIFGLILAVTPGRRRRR